ncbi:IS630 family transposase [Streptomyces sp. NBC_00481]|uniref:IS630 family transposase n=1 Tax=Streptomyces sp. NBC_00481 TaxID=2975755 RepID=UPI002DDA9A4B|nr:IS630 family transposase [Streptomyces sp. NBC_00481]WRY95037.1 IS630 family transposase [Streptomyces sp. NBC_00481]
MGDSRLQPLVLSEDERLVLRGWAKRRTTAQGLAKRARIVLACADGLNNTAVAARLDTDRGTVSRWRTRFLQRRLDGLSDEPRPGVPRTITDAQVEEVVVRTLEEVPEGATHWSKRELARRVGISPTSVLRIWRAFGLQPWRTETFKISPEPLLIDKIRDVVGLYLAPPANAAVFAVDEKPQIHCHRLTLYEAAFLSGGPARVADLTLVSMARRRRLLLAHTGWATVVDPDGRDEMERSVIGAIGPGGQSRIASVRRSAATADPVRRLSDRLVAAGLAVPEAVRTSLADAVTQVRGAALGVCGLGALALMLPSQGFEEHRVLVALWFALPLVLTLSCLVIVRVEGQPCTRWASAEGVRVLGAVVERGGGDSADLVSVAVRGVGAVESAALRAAFGHR